MEPGHACACYPQPETFRLVVGNGITGAPAMTIPAKYENGVFRPLEDVQIKEGTVVEVLVPAEQEPAGKLTNPFAEAG